jgi:ABC-2 type transport system permease protein
VTPAEEREARLAVEPMRSAAPPAHFFRGTKESLVQIWERRDLLNRLVRREIRARYKDSVLGVIWSLIRPLVSLLIYYLAIGKVLGASRSIDDFAIYVFTGLTAWQLMSDSIMTATGSIVGNSGIIKKIQLPREIFPLSAVGASLFNFLMQLIILLVAALLIRGMAFDARLLYLPLSLMVIVVWGTALGMFLSAANVYFRDIQYLVEVILMVGMWASPIVYSWEMVSAHVGPVLEEIYMSNPVTLAVLGFQRTVWLAGESAPVVTHLAVRLLIALGIGVVFLWLSQRIFSVMQRDFAQEL